MSTWLYQMSPKNWNPNRYRVDIWEDHQWAWPVGRISPSSAVPAPGDTVVFFYAPSGGEDPGFYGWAVIVEWYRGNGSSNIYFRPVSPSDYLKMHPWWDDTAQEIADKIRGRVKQGTLWQVQPDLALELRKGITAWLSNST